MALPMQAMIAAGRGLVLLRGISDRELRDVEHAVWDKLDGTSAEKVAALLRFRALVGVLCGRPPAAAVPAARPAADGPGARGGGRDAAQRAVGLQFGEVPAGAGGQAWREDQRIAPRRPERAAELQVAMA